MKKSILKLSLLLLLITVVYFSCKSTNRKDLILGTWEINDPQLKASPDNMKAETIFLNNGVARLRSYVNNKLSYTDSMFYHVTDDGEYLVVKGKANELDSQRIVELTGKILRIRPEGIDDTTSTVLIKK